MSGEKFCLKWNDYEPNISAAFRDIREEEEFFDLTIACDDDKEISAHKVILSACSPFFRGVLKRNPHQHPLLYLKGVSYKDMCSVLSFMYHGEVNVAQDELNSFLQVAEDLRVKGLTQNGPPSSNSESKRKSEARVNPSIRRKSVDSTPAPKRFRPAADPPVKPATMPVMQEEDDDIQEVEEVMPVKAEPDSAAANIPLAADDSVIDGGGGTIAMYSDEMSRELGLEDAGNAYGGDERYEEEYGNEYAEDQQGYLVEAGLDQTSGMYIDCPVCAKPMYKKNLARHIAAKHTDQAPSQCSLCFKTMKNGWSLKEHERKYHGIFQSQKDVST